MTIDIEQLSVSPFAKQVYRVLLTVPRGKVTTYKALAEAVGSRAYRQVGRVLGANPCIPDIPCHRVVATNGYVQGYAHGLEKKVALLRAEGVRLDDKMIVAEEDILRVLS